MKNRQVLLNATTTFAQVIGSAVALFFLYRFLIRTIGIEQLGIWSLVLATTSVVTLANQGFSASIVKFVAKYAAWTRAEDVSVLIQTAVISMGLALGLFALALYPVAKWILKIIIPAGLIGEALAILPYAFVTLWLNVVGGIFLAGLAGYELITQKNYVLFGSAVIYWGFCIGFVPRYGLLGLAYAQLAQAVLAFVTVWSLLRRINPRIPVLPYRWDRAFFREMFKYGATFQCITVTQALREPVTKTLLAKFGGLASTGFYDMASRWIFTLREILAQSNLVLVPTISNLCERSPSSIATVYRESYRLMFFLAIPTFSFLIAIGPVVSQIWFGRFEPVFVGFVALLGVGWLVNVLSSPAYTIDLGTGNLRWVVIGCSTTGILNLGLGFLAGKYFGGTAVVVTSVFSLAIGYIAIVAAYQIHNGVRFSQLLPKESIAIVLSSLAGVLIFLPFLSNASTESLFSARPMSGLFFALLTMIFLPMWIHPMRKRLTRWVFSLWPAGISSNVL
ncbi:MAG: oligosaccharide flippase family protein [Candidatus Acidiferrales bacterium]